MRARARRHEHQPTGQDDMSNRHAKPKREHGLPLALRRGDTMRLWQGERGDPPDDAHVLDVLEVTISTYTVQLDEGKVYRLEDGAEPKEILPDLKVYRGHLPKNGRQTARFWGES